MRTFLILLLCPLLLLAEDLFELETSPLSSAVVSRFRSIPFSGWSGFISFEESDSLHWTQESIFQQYLCTTLFSYKASLFEMGQIARSDVGIGFMHGIDTALIDCLRHGERLIEYAGGSKVQFVYAETCGFNWDLYRTTRAYNYTTYEPTRTLLQMWDNFFSKAPEDAEFLMICHSGGAMFVRNALDFLPENWRKRIHILAIAPARYIDPSLCKSVVHYRVKASRDHVPRYDIIGNWRFYDTIITLESAENAPRYDHLFDSPTYQEAIRETILKYLTGSL